MYRAIAGLSSPPSANDSQSEVRTAGGINPVPPGSASVPETNFNRGLMGGVGRQVESMRAPDSEQPAQSVLAGPDESVKFANLPPEVLRDIAERKGRSFAGNLFNDIPWWAMVGPAGGPARVVAAEGSRLYGPVAESLLAPKGPLTGGARTTLTSADEGLPVGYSILRNPPKADTSALAGQTSNLVQQLRAAGIPEDQIAASIARINAGAAGREAAAAGREAAAAGREATAAGEQAAGREATTAGEAAADGGVGELANAGNAGRAPKTGAGEAAGSAPATGSVPQRGEAFGDVSWSNDIAARDQATDFVTSGKYELGQVVNWYRDQLISNANLDNAVIDREIARFIQQFTGGAK